MTEASPRPMTELEILEPEDVIEPDDELPPERSQGQSDPWHGLDDFEES